MTSSLVFLKLGGSLITDKSKPDTPRIAVLERLAKEIRRALTDQPQLSLLIGHGSGSFDQPVKFSRGGANRSETKPLLAGVGAIARAVAQGCGVAE